MIVIEYILIYLAAGCVCDFFYMQVEKWLDKKSLLKQRLSEYDRITAILLWPVGLGFFLWGYIRELLKNTKD